SGNGQCLRAIDDRGWRWHARFRKEWPIRHVWPRCIRWFGAWNESSGRHFRNGQQPGICAVNFWFTREFASCDEYSRLIQY
ncbi:hypothetical protein OAK45_08545, partial [Verrucomicrobia bacterium]|nr:hypothetical protein [Verrucomicrobiota bacterium]